MDWLGFFASAAIGSLLGLLAKEGIDWLRAERAHRLELQRRYFDAKLDATIRVIRQIKTATANLRSFAKLVKENEETNGWIHPALIKSVSESFGKGGEKINEEAAGMLALVGFYYDDDLQRLAEAGGGPQVPLLQKFSEFIFHMEQSAEARQVLDSQPPADVVEIAQKKIKFHDEAAFGSIGDIAKLADALDQLANSVVTRMREDYKTIRF